MAHHKRRRPKSSRATMTRPKLKKRRDPRKPGPRKPCA